MHKQSLAISVGLHAVVLIVATVSLPWLRHDFDIPQPVSVDLIDVSKITQTNKRAHKPIPKPDKPQPKKEDKPPPASQNTSHDAVAPIPQQPPRDTPKDEKKDKPVVVTDKKSDKKPDKKTHKKDAKPEPQKDFSSVLKNLVASKDTPSDSTTPDLDPKDKTKPDAAQDAPLGARMTMSEEDALRRQLSKCWLVPYGAKDADKTVVQIQMSVNPDRTLRSASVVDTARYDSDSFFRAMADSAIRAVRNPLCSPFQLPPDKYDTWKNITVTFDPSQMFQ